jgi:hypothetical protein
MDLFGIDADGLDLVSFTEHALPNKPHSPACTTTGATAGLNCSLCHVGTYLTGSGHLAKSNATMDPVPESPEL